MPSQYTGQPNNVLITLPGALSIASTTNTNPIVVTTASPLPASFVSGIYVDIVDHQTNDAANGINQATVTGASTFTIPVAGNGVGGATGTVQPLYPGGSYAIPSDGDTRSAASVDVGFEALGDKASFLSMAAGAWKVVQVLHNGLSGDNFTHTISTSVTTTSTATDTGLNVTYHGANANDVFVAQFNATVENMLVGEGIVGFGLFAVLFHAGTTTPQAGLTLIGPQFGWSANSVGGSNVATVSASIYGAVNTLNASGVQAGTLKIGAYVTVQSGTPATIQFLGDWSITGLLLRSTSVAQ